jgi:hypothetical protein
MMAPAAGMPTPAGMPTEQVCRIDEPGQNRHLGAMGSSWCPRCGSDLVAPSALNSAWRCAEHGQVLPLSVFHRIDQSSLDHVRTHAEVPLWLPDPPPANWTMTGLAAVGDARSRVRGTVASLSGPAPLGGQGEWLFVAEEPGIGLGATYARTAADAPPPTTSAPPTAKIHAFGRPTSLWPVPDAGDDRSAYVGEAEGVWLWLISFPADAGYAVLENLHLTDIRHALPPSIPSGPLSTRLRPSS